MVADTLQEMQDDGISDCRSPGSNYHHSSQSRKVSVGILIDQLANKRYGARGKDKAVPNEEMETPRKGTSEGEKDKGEDVGGNEGKISEAREQITSPWITTKSANQTAQTSENVLNGKETSKLASAGGSKKKLSNKKDPPVTHSVKYFANQSSGHSDDGKEKSFNGLTYTRKRSQNESSQKQQDFTFPTAHEVPITDKEKAGNVAVPKTDNLRMKLWEVLGAVSSPKSQPPNLKGHDVGANISKPTDGSNDDLNIRYKQNSDPIETDSDSPAHSMKRPLTRASTRKRVSTKRQPLKPKIDPFAALTQKVQRKDVFTFKEGLADKVDVAANGNPCTSTRSRRKGQKKTANIMPRKISFISNSSSDNFPGVIQTNEVPATTAKTSSHMFKMGILKNNMQAQKGGCQGKASHQSQREDSHHSVGEPGLTMNEGFTHPTVPKDRDQSQDFGLDSPLSKIGSPQDSKGSPTLKMNSPVSSPYTSSPKAEQPAKEVQSPAISERSSSPVGNIFHFITSGASKPGGCAANSELDASEDDGAGMKDSPEVQSSPEKVGKDGSRSSRSMSEDEKTESSDDVSPVATGHTGTPITETGASGRSEFNLAKRLRTEERASKPSSSLSYRKGFNDHELTQEPGESCRGDDGDRVIMLVALAVENYVKKVKAATSSKSAEIMMAVSTEIDQQLQNIKLQTQEDVANLTSISTSKRKRVESGLREQAEQLKKIHEKFEQDIHQCLQNYNLAVEGLESYQNELKGTMKKQKAIHQKSLMQAEETVEKLLVDAQRKIEAVRKMGREKVVQLRYVVAESIKDVFRGST
ncbi:unnamed protein product [Linum trigynum]|uniref:Meiosis-specific protein ASY3-like coiled-coil domain-containing protein n=1 Tax=Linum trigynum TaxID=586398 RepID=A0AAV2FKL2_9ROSI